MSRESQLTFDTAVSETRQQQSQIGFFHGAISDGVSGGAATSYAFSGPSSGTVNVASTNFTVTPNGTSSATVTPASDGAGSFTPATVTFDGTAAAKTFTYTPTSTTGSPHTLSVTDDGGLTDPSSIDYTVNAATATSYTMTGPTSGLINVASTDFTLTPNGNFTGVITPASDGAGTFTPTSRTWSGDASAKTFTYTPTSVAGSPHTISSSDDGGLTDPATIDYAVSSNLTAGAVGCVDADTTTINMLSAAATGGTGSKTYQWYRSTTTGFTPGPGNLLSGATSLTLADSASLSSGTYYYRVIATDAAAATATSAQAMGSLWSAPLKIGFIGDSITHGINGTSTIPPPTFFADLYSSIDVPRRVTTNNRGIGGTSSSDWISGSAYLIAAKASFASGSYTHVHIMLGTNDHGRSPTDYGNNIESCANDLVGAGYIVILSYPPSPNNNNTATYPYSELANLVGYQAEIDALVNGTTILQGDRRAFNYFGEHLDLLQSGSAHPTDDGNLALALLWCDAVRNALNPVAGGAVQPVIGSGGLVF
jgi:lysophospholipase L1-like esterase